MTTIQGRRRRVALAIQTERPHRLALLLCTEFSREIVAGLIAGTIIGAFSVYHAAGEQAQVAARQAPVRTERAVYVYHL